jgi:hypothetical protein
MVGTKIPPSLAFFYGIFSLAISFIILIIFVFLSFTIDESLGFHPAGSIFVFFLIACVCWFYPVLWLKFTSTFQRKIPTPWPMVPSAVPWLLIPLLVISTFYFRVTEIVSVDLSGLFPPLAVWMGLRYRKTGFMAFALGASPMLFGYSWGALSNANETANYLFCLACCRAFGDLEWLGKGFELFRTRRLLTLMALLLLPVGFNLRLDQVQFGYFGYELWILVAFVCGLLRKNAYRYIATASAVAIAVKTFNMMNVPIQFRQEFFAIGYYLDSLREIISLWICAWLGRCLAHIAHAFDWNRSLKDAPGLGNGDPGSSPGDLLRSILRLIPRRPHGQPLGMWRGTAYLFILLLAYHQIDIVIPIEGLFNHFSEAFGVTFLTAYTASILAGVVIGRRSFWVIALVGGLIMLIEPILLTSPKVLFYLWDIVEIRFRVLPLRHASEFVSCALCVWLGIYLRKTI